MNPKLNSALYSPMHSAFYLILGLVLGSMLLAPGCSSGPRKARGALDTPDHHVVRGHDAIDAGKWGKAGRDFNLALELDPEYSPALAGKAVVVAHGASGSGLSDSKREDAADEAEDLYEEAIDNAKNPAQTRGGHVAAIRVLRMTQPSDDWLEDAEEHYEDARDTKGAGRDSDPHFFMARAYSTAFDLPKASQLYQTVLSKDQGRVKQADEELEIVHIVIRARPGTRHGKVVAFMESVNRADMAALFLEELLLERLYTRAGGGEVDTSFQPSGQNNDFETETVTRLAKATDIDDHPLRGDIEEILALGVAGLEPDPAHLFHPDKKINRAEFALMVEDILVKVTGEQGLRTKFIGGASPFRDVRNDMPYFNAVQTVVSRKLMQPKEAIRGLFKPRAPVTGAEALLVIRLLKSELRSYLRS